MHANTHSTSIMAMPVSKYTSRKNSRHDVRELSEVSPGGSKGPKEIQAELDELDDLATDLSDPGRMTSFDVRDMSRMGKRQEMRRVFRQFSILSLTTVIMASWEFLLTANTQGLVDGGRAGLFWSYLWTLCGFGMVIASMAEMASMVGDISPLFRTRACAVELTCHIGSHKRRTISLGFGVWARKVPEIPQLHHGLAVDHVIPSGECLRLLPRGHHYPKSRDGQLSRVRSSELAEHNVRPGRGPSLWDLQYLLHSLSPHPQQYHHGGAPCRLCRGRCGVMGSRAPSSRL